MVNYVNKPAGLSLLSYLNFPHKIGILERIYGRQLAKNGKCWVKTHSGMEWKLDLTDATQRWIVYDSYEGRAVTAWIRSLFKDGGVAVESGSNIGQTLMYYADLADRIIAIDPLQTAIDWVSECKNHNALSNIETINAGLADKRTRLKLQMSGPHSTFRTDWYQNAKHETVEIDVYPLDELAQMYNTDKIRFWKIDVEGMENEVLQGANSLLSNKQIDALFIEVTGGSFHKVKQTLQKNGYDLYIIDDKQKPDRVHSPRTTHTTTYISLPDQN